MHRLIDIDRPTFLMINIQFLELKYSAICAEQGGKQLAQKS